MTSLLDPATESSGVTSPRPAVPWLTVIPLAVVMAYADGFWLTSLRGAVGAIERTKGPFATWLRESTLALPVFVLAVLAALTLAMRWFGPELSRRRNLVATALMVVAAGTLVGIAEVATSSAYDYYLQSGQLHLMDSMRNACAGGSCVAEQQQATLLLQVRAVAFGSGILLVTNLVLVGWAVAMRGGRLEVSATRGRPHSARPNRARPNRSRADDLRVLLAAGLFGTAAIHAAVIPEHLTEWAAAGLFFIVLAVAEGVVAGLLLNRLQTRALFAAAVFAIGPLALWLYSRTVGMPFGPGAGNPEGVGLPDVTSGILEVVTLLFAVALLRHLGLQQRPPLSAHVRWLGIVAVVAVTALGLAGSSLVGFGDLGSAGDQPVMGSPR